MRLKRKYTSRASSVITDKVPNLICVHYLPIQAKMTVIIALPRGLKNSDFVRNSPEKQLSAEAPPIQFIPNSITKTRNATEKVHVMIMFPSKITNAF